MRNFRVFETNVHPTKSEDGCNGEYKGSTKNNKTFYGTLLIICKFIYKKGKKRKYMQIPQVLAPFGTLQVM
jgi:hypothetical protein